MPGNYFSGINKMFTLKQLEISTHQVGYCTHNSDTLHTCHKQSENWTNTRLHRTLSYPHNPAACLKLSVKTCCLLKALSALNAVCLLKGCVPKTLSAKPSSLNVHQIAIHYQMAIHYQRVIL